MNIHTRTFEVDEVTYFTAKDALRDILFMYYDMSQFNGFGHNVECGQFNPYWFLKVKVIQDGYISKAEVQILQQGAAIKLLNWANEHLDDLSLNVLDKDTWPYHNLLESGSLNHIPEAERALKAAFTDYNLFQDSLKNVYKTYVVDTINGTFNG